MTVESTRSPRPDLAALVGSRLCHDIVSPLGAIGNGLELLQMSDAYPGIANSPELQLISDAVSAARERIQAFRMAFGQAGGDQRIARAELAQYLAGMAAQGRLRIDLDADGDFARREVRMVLLGLMCLESAMPWGGRVLVCRAGPGWRLVAEAERTKSDPALWAWLTGVGERAELRPAQVHFALLAGAAAEAERRLSCDLDEKGAEISF